MTTSGGEFVRVVIYLIWTCASPLLCSLIVARVTYVLFGATISLLSFPGNTETLMWGGVEIRKVLPLAGFGQPCVALNVEL